MYERKINKKRTKKYLKKKMILQNHRRLPVSIFSVKIAAIGSLKRVTGRIFILVKISKLVISKTQAKTLSLIFSSTKKHVKSISARSERTYLLL
jgi:hypothetical protein